MRFQQGAVLGALRNSGDFLDANPQLGVNDSSARRNLDDAKTQLTTHGIAQNGSARASTGETAKQRALRLDLRFNHMRPIAVIAKQKLRGVPEFEALKMPRGNLTGEPLVIAAGGMADAATPHAQVLMDNGLPTGFIDALRAAAEALTQSMSGRGLHLQTRSGSTAGLTAEERRGRAILKVLDSMVRPKIGDNPALLAAWDTAKQIRRVSRSAATPAVAPGTTPAATPAATPVAHVAPVAPVATPAATSVVPPVAPPAPAVPAAA